MVDRDKKLDLVPVVCDSSLMTCTDGQRLASPLSETRPAARSHALVSAE
jgi:hypothetical protein